MDGDERIFQREKLERLACVLDIAGINRVDF